MNHDTESDPILDRFFERQRSEIMDRIRADQTARRTRRAVGGLAAAVVAAGAILLAVPFPPQPSGTPSAEWFWNLSVAENGFDPLAPYGVWPPAGAESHEDTWEEDTLLPPLPFDGRDAARSNRL